MGVVNILNKIKLIELIPALIKGGVLVEGLLFTFFLITMGGSNFFLILIYAFLGILFALLLWLAGFYIIKFGFYLKSKPFLIIPFILMITIYCGLFSIGLKASIVFHSVNTKRESAQKITDNDKYNSYISTINSNKILNNSLIEMKMADLKENRLEIKQTKWKLTSTNLVKAANANKKIKDIEEKNNELETAIDKLKDDNEILNAKIEKLKRGGINIEKDVLQPSLVRFGEKDVEDLLFNIWRMVYIMLQLGLLTLMFIERYEGFAKEEFPREYSKEIENINAVQPQIGNFDNSNQSVNEDQINSIIKNNDQQERKTMPMPPPILQALHKYYNYVLKYTSCMLKDNSNQLRANDEICYYLGLPTSAGQKILVILNSLKPEEGQKVLIEEKSGVFFVNYPINKVLEIIKDFWEVTDNQLRLAI